MGINQIVTQSFLTLFVQVIFPDLQDHTRQVFALNAWIEDLGSRNGINYGINGIKWNFFQS